MDARVKPAHDGVLLLLLLGVLGGLALKNSAVMAGPDPAIHVVTQEKIFKSIHWRNAVDARVKPAHDGCYYSFPLRAFASSAVNLFFSNQFPHLALPSSPPRVERELERDLQPLGQKISLGHSLLIGSQLPF